MPTMRRPYMIAPPKEVDQLVTNYMHIFSADKKDSKALGTLLEDLTKSESFLKYMSCCLLVMDYSTMEYLFVSENIKSWTGITAAEFKSLGPTFVVRSYHPNDGKILVNVLYKRIKNFLQQIPLEERHQYRFSWNFRAYMPTGELLHMTQHSTYYDYDLEGNPRINVATITDISKIKRDSRIFLNISHVLDDTGVTTISEEYLPEDDSKFFTPSERRILELLANGLDTTTIAENLFISENTVKNHKKNMFAKAGVKKSIELIEFARKKGAI